MCALEMRVRVEEKRKEWGRRGARRRRGEERVGEERKEWRMRGH